MINNLKPIPEIDLPSVEQFQTDIYFKTQPVVMRGIARDWEPVAKGIKSPEALGGWLKNSVGDSQVKVLAGMDPDDSTFFYDENLIDINFDRDEMAFEDFDDTILVSFEDKAAKKL